MDESAYVSQRSEEGPMAAYEFEMQLDLLISCDKHEVAMPSLRWQVPRAMGFYPEGQRK